MIRRRVWLLRLVWVTTGLVLFVTGPVAADVSVINHMFTSFAPADPGIRAHAYGTGIEHRFDSAAGFGAGTIVGPGSVAGDVVEIDGVPAAEWWNAGWQRRQCFDASADSNLGQYPIRVAADTTGLAADDIRVVPVTVPAAAATPVPHYVEPDVGTAETAIWFQAWIGAAQTYCVYFDSGAGSTSNEFAPFTYSNGQTITYYTMTSSYNGGGPNGQVQVVSYVDGNVVSDGTTSVTLNTGGIHVFSGMDQNSFVTATGPIDASFDRSNRESLLPEGFADDTFVFPTNRYQERFWIRSPFGATTVEAVVNGTVVASVAVSPASGSVQLAAAASGGQIVILRSTDGTDFLATHRATNGGDIFHGVPWFGDPLVGVASTILRAGSVNAQTVTYDASNGAGGSLATSPNTQASIGGNGSRGNGRAYQLTGAGQFHAIQQADSNGLESTSFLPTRLLSQTIRIPIGHRYVAIACPVPSTILTIAGTPTSCDTGASIGHHRRGLGVFPAGTLIQADHPIYAYYETISGSDEHNVYGAKGAIPYVRNPTVVAGPVETNSISACVTWTSASFATADVFGLTSIDVDGTFTYQISFDGGSFVGPDDTGATSFDGASFVPYSVDGSTTAQLQVEFCGSSGDQLRSVGFECELVEVIDGTPLVSVVNGGPALRVYPNTAGNDTWVEFVSASGADSYQLATDSNGTHVEAVAGTVTNPAPIFAAQPYTVIFSGVSPQTSQLTVNLIERGSVQLEVPVSFDITG